MLPVECPHCEATFQLDPDTLGKVIRCPECRQAFTATATKAPPVPVESAPVAIPSPTSLPTPAGRVEEFVSVFDLSVRRPYERVESDAVHLVPEGDAPRRPVAPVRIKVAAKPADDDIPTLAPIAKSKPAPAGPKEIAWSGDAPPAARGTPAGRALTVPQSRANAPEEGDDDDEEQELFVRRKRRRRSWGKIIFLGFLAAVVGSTLVGGLGLWRYYAVAESRLHDGAKLAFEEGNFPVAQQKYELLLVEYPGSTDTDRYRFFAALAETHNALGGVMVRENPTPAREAFTRFTTEFAQSPLAMPESGYGAEIVQLGRKLVDVLADHAGDRLTAFKLDRKKLTELDATAEGVAVAEALIPTVDKFRDKTAVTLDTQRKRLTDLTAAVAVERHRLSVLAPFRTLSDDPTALRIEDFQAALKANALSTDAEAVAMLAAAEASLQKLIGYLGKRVPSGIPPADLAPPVLFSSRVGAPPKPTDGVVAGAVGDVVFGVARGVVYALDAATGAQLWGTRIAAPTADLRAVDQPVRVTMGDQDWVLVAGDIGGKPGLTARLARTGEPVWYQPLEAPPAGRPVVSGGRVYLPLRDATGTVAEFETASGARTGELTLRQPVGAGLSLLPTGRTGANLLVVPGDMKRVFLFELGREDADGQRLPPRCVRVLLTDHPRDSLRGEVAVIAPGDEAGPRYLVLTQTDGPTAMKLRAFAVPKPDEIVAAGAAGPVSTSDKPSEVAVAGWSWFPAVSDGERLVLASDAGAFFALGVNQIGNADAPLFTLPAPKAPAEQDGVARSVVVQVEEDAYWVVLAGRLTRLRTAVDPVQGLRIVAQGPGQLVGEPLHRAELRPAANLGVVVCRSPGAASVQAVAFDLGTGSVRWIRRLGVAPAGPPVALAGNRALVIDEDGGVSSVNTSPTRTGPSVVAEPVASPYAESTGKSGYAASADGQTVWVVTPEADKAGRRVRLRNLVGGKLQTDVVVPLPDQLAGPPVVLGPAVLLPLVNGYVYRFGPGDGQLMVGPQWRGDGGAGELQCLLGPHGPDEFFATDGGRKFIRWKWPLDPAAKPAMLVGSWELTTKIALPPLAFDTGSGPMVAVADAGGTLFTFDANKVADPLRRWRGTPDGPIPLGRPTLRLTAVPTAAGLRLVYGVAERSLVGIDPDRAAPAWVAVKLIDESAGELLGFTVAGEEVFATDPTGRVIVLNAATGDRQAELPPAPGQSLAVTAAVPTGTGEVLQLGLDGTGTLMPRK